MVVDAFQLVSLRVKLRQTVSGAEDDSKKLWNTEHEVDKLRNEEEHHCLAEMT